jgi:hypothetical protein
MSLLKDKRSEIVWAIWFIVGIAWELWCVKQERKTGDEPLTRIVRDRLMKSKSPVGIITRLSFICFIGWLVLHWLTPLAW